MEVFSGRGGGCRFASGEYLAAPWRPVLREDLVIEHPTSQDPRRMADVTARYADRPMDFADASLVAIGERLNIERIVTLDRPDLSIYRLFDRKPFAIVGPA